MTRKDFEAFADMVRAERASITTQRKDSIVRLYITGREAELENVIDGMIKIFMDSNKNFSPSRFRAACTPQENKEAGVKTK